MDSRTASRGRNEPGLSCRGGVVGSAAVVAAVDAVSSLPSRRCRLVIAVVIAIAMAVVMAVIAVVIAVVIAAIAIAMAVVIAVVIAVS